MSWRESFMTLTSSFNDLTLTLYDQCDLVWPVWFPCLNSDCFSAKNFEIVWNKWWSYRLRVNWNWVSWTHSKHSRTYWGFSLNPRNINRVPAMLSSRHHWKNPPEKMRQRQFSSMETSWFLVEFTRTKFNFKLKLIMFISGDYESSMCSMSIFKAIKCGHMTCSKGRTAACTISCRWTDPMMILTQAVFTVWLYCWSIFHHFAMNLASAIFLVDANSIFSQVRS